MYRNKCFFSGSAWGQELGNGSAARRLQGSCPWDIFHKGTHTKTVTQAAPWLCCMLLGLYSGVNRQSAALHTAQQSRHGCKTQVRMGTGTTEL